MNVRKNARWIVLGLAAGWIAGAAVAGAAPAPHLPVPELGPFSVSLTVQDLPASREFYEALGFEALPGSDAGGLVYGESWLMLERAGTKIGLFQGLFDTNTLTFNPPDVRSLQAHLESRGVEFVIRAPDGDGPASAMLVDPDGNPILLDQF